jgi:2-polyprenyl-3-methyl-5-hydroxy-6-metoxy-1,4-benzoquinol methylase
MTTNRGQRIADSWSANAEAWIEAVRAGRIESRRVATDRAIVDAVLARSPRRVLDVGCGEGWLCRALIESGVETVGIDGSARLIEAARAAGAGRYEIIDYAAFIQNPQALESFDAVACNFALLEQDMEPLLRAIGRALSMHGSLLIQTVHPWIAAGDDAYTDGWRNESFAAFGGKFREPMPWYFRTLESWVATLHGCGYAVQAISEPLHPQTSRPLSLLLVAISARDKVLAGR